MHDAGHDDCDKCEGKGHIPVENTDKAYNPFPNYRRCICLVQRQFRTSVGEDIYNADSIESSPFMEWIEDDVFIKGRRNQMLPHLRYVLFNMGAQFFFREVTDRDLVDAWLGKDDRTDVADQDIQTGYKNLTDASMPPDLLMIRMGVKKTPNKELPNVIFEAVKSRRDQGFPTWLMNSPTYPFRKGSPGDPRSGHMCYSKHLDQYIDSHFETYRFDSPDSDDPSGGSGGSDSDDGDLSNVNKGMASAFS
jgi:hypothetical protein